MLNLKNVYIISKGNRESYCVVSRIEEFLKNIDINVYTYFDKNDLDFFSNIDLVMAVGGDGTLLKAFRYTRNNTNLLYVGINTGSLGMLQNVREDQLGTFLQSLINGSNLKVKETNILEMIVTFKNQKVLKRFALNEIVIRGNTISMDLYSNDVSIVGNNFKASGVIFSTSTGSTGYLKSENGPILMEDIPYVIQKFLAPIRNKITGDFIDAPTVSKKYKICNLKGKFDLLVDDALVSIVDEIESIEFKISEKPIKLLIYNDLKKEELIRTKILDV